MNKYNVCIIIFPEDLNLRELDGYDEGLYGKIFSDISMIQANPIPGGYTILYRDNIFPELDTKRFGDNIIDLFTKNLPGEMIELSIDYQYMDSFSDETGIAIIQLDDYLSECDHEDIMYVESKTVEYINYCFDDDLDGFNFDRSDDDDDCDGDCNNCPRQFSCQEEEDYDEEDDDDDYDEDDGYDDLGYNYFNPFYDNHYRKNKKKSYGSSRIMRDSNKIKRNIRRHGVVICSNKGAIQHDKKILRSFLKDFVKTGNKKLDKRFQEELIKRWMVMYTATKKESKYRQRHYDKHRKDRLSSYVSRETAESIARRIFPSNDIFYDPSK